MSHVFLSHGSEDRAEANQLCAFIEARGVTAWIAPRDVRPGMDYSEELQRAIEGAAAFVVLVTETANKSPYVRAETEMAFSSHKPIFPVRLADVKPAAGLALFLKIRHWTDAYGPGRDESLDRLAAELKALSGATEAPAGAPSPVPPEPASPPAPRPALPLADEERLAAAIGPKAPWYLERWRTADAKNSTVSWNWAACLASVYWFAYRKLWLWLALVAAAFVLLSIVGALEPRLGQITFLVSIAITFVTGAFGNHWYRKQVTALAANASLDLDALRSRGGVSLPALWGAIGATALLFAVVGALAVKQLPNQPGPPPAPPAGGSGDQPADAGQAPAPYAPPQVVLDHNYLVGRWSDDGNCANSYEFLADGRFVAVNGAEGVWSLEGSQLNMGGPGGGAVVTVSPIDQNTMTVTNADGQMSNPIRCVG